jgi:hypothetical protein
MDYYNATLCAIQLNRETMAKNLIDSCIKRGFSKDYFFNNYTRPLENYLNSTFFSNHYDSIHTVYLNSFNDSILKILKVSFATDQKFVFDFLSNNASGDDYYDVVLANIDTLVQIMKDDLIPFYPYKYQPYPRMENLPWVTIRHYFGLRNSIRRGVLDSVKYSKYYKMDRFFDNSFENLLREKINEGKICPILLTSTVIYNSNDDNLFGDNGYIQIGNDSIYKDLYYKEFSESEVLKISKERQRLYLDDFQSFQKKSKFLTGFTDSTFAMDKGCFRFRINILKTSYCTDGNPEYQRSWVEMFSKQGYKKL